MKKAISLLLLLAMVFALCACSGKTEDPKIETIQTSTDVFSVENPGVCALTKALADDLGLAVTIDFVVKGAHSLNKFANEKDEYGTQVREKVYLGKSSERYTKTARKPEIDRGTEKANGTAGDKHGLERYRASSLRKKRPFGRFLFVNNMNIIRPVPI